MILNWMRLVHLEIPFWMNSNFYLRKKPLSDRPAHFFYSESGKYLKLVTWLLNIRGLY